MSVFSSPKTNKRTKQKKQTKKEKKRKGQSNKPKTRKKKEKKIPNNRPKKKQQKRKTNKDPPSPHPITKNNNIYITPVVSSILWIYIYSWSCYPSPLKLWVRSPALPRSTRYSLCAMNSGWLVAIAAVWLITLSGYHHQ